MDFLCLGGDKEESRPRSGPMVLRHASCAAQGCALLANIMLLRFFFEQGQIWQPSASAFRNFFFFAKPVGP